jgi:energy-coupling factor transporter ATP-binding protein EcfA2
MDPLLTPLLMVVLGNLAHDLITDACKDYLKDKLKSVFGWLEKLGEGDKVEHAYRDAMEQAFGACLEMLLSNIKSYGYSDEELKEYRPSLKSFIKDKEVAEELLNAIREPGHNDVPSADVLRKRWKAIGGQDLPNDNIWNTVVLAFRRQAKKRLILSDPLREILNAQNLQELKELIERQGGVKVQVRRDKYSQRMRIKFSPVDLANLMPAYADDPGQMVIRDVFVAQHVRENPPPVEIPKDLAERLNKAAKQEGEDEDVDEQQLEKLRLTYVNQSPRPVLEVIAQPPYRLMVLTGDPGSGKSTLMRYLLTGIIEPPIDPKTGQPLPWTESFKDAFSLLIELRDFYFLRQRGECDTFLEYVAYMGKTDQWFLDDHAVHDYLESGPSLVMFDGLDEIFDASDRERVMHEIAGFAQRYTRAKIIVTSRPVGYKEQILRDAGFAHFGIQDLDDGQIETFIQGWFALTFPQQPQQAAQRIERVCGSVRKSRPIRLLAGNPLLLTIMVLLAREEELPRERAKFYEKAVEVLCHHWDANRNLDLPQDRYLNADDKKALLRRIAMQMQAGPVGLKGNVIQEDDLLQEIQSFLIDEQWQPNAAEAKKAARRMIQQLRERNYILCLRGPSLYGFVHRTFLEYLTAAEYVRRFDRQPQQMTIDDLVELFDKHCRDDDWREVLRLICGQIDEQFVSRIIEHLAARTDLKKWKGDTPLPELPLAIWCLSEIRNLAKLDSTGDILLAAVVSLFMANRVRVEEKFLQEIVDAADSLTVAWPGQRNIPYKSRLPSEMDLHHLFWPKVITAILKNRSITQELIISEQWASRAGAIQVLAEKWPDETTRTLLTDSAVRDRHTFPRRIALQSLADKWTDQITRALVTERFGQDEDGDVRRAAIQILANKWSDEITRKLLMECAVHDADRISRGKALGTLADKWPDEVTRALMTERVINDDDSYPRSTGFEKLLDIWPDEAARALLTKCAVQDRDTYNRHAALIKLAGVWPDEITRALLTERFIQDEGLSAYSRGVLLDKLADVWPDEAMRKLLTQYALEHADSYVRGAAFEKLADTWPDDATRTMLIERAVEDKDSNPRSVALKKLAAKWSDEAIRTLLTERAVQDPEGGPRSEALETLANRWPDETTRLLLTERAVQDIHDNPRSTALRALADKWQDGVTRTLMTERAVEDVNSFTRRAAFEKLALYWPDDATRTFLIERAVNDEDSKARHTALEEVANGWPSEATDALLMERSRVDGFAASRIAGRHSEFGKIVFTRDLDGIAPYIDPAVPISEDQIMRVANRTDVLSEEIDDVVRSLSAHMGWDILKGSTA